MKPFNKAAQIRQLYAKGFEVRTIANLVGCREEYVRVCARQRVLSAGISESDVRYLKRRFGGRNYLEALRRRNAHDYQQRKLYPEAA